MNVLHSAVCSAPSAIASYKSSSHGYLPHKSIGSSRPAAHVHLQATAIRVATQSSALSLFASALQQRVYLSVGIQQHDMKQKIVIKVSMSSEKSRSKAMALVARADGVSSMGITGDGKDRLEVVGVDVDTVCLVTCLRKKLGHADILQVEEVKDKKPEEKPKPKVVELPQYYCPCYYGYYCHYHRH